MVEIDVLMRHLGEYTARGFSIEEAVDVVAQSYPALGIRSWADLTEDQQSDIKLAMMRKYEPKAGKLNLAERIQKDNLSKQHKAFTLLRVIQKNVRAYDTENKGTVMIHMDRELIDRLNRFVRSL